MTVKPVNTAPGTTEDMPTALRDLAQNDQALDTRLTTVEGTLAPLPGGLAAETNRATAAEQAITSNLTAETNRAKAAEALLAPLASPALTGTPTAPTAPAGDNSTKIANTAFVQLAVAGGGVQAVLYGGSQTLSLSQQSTARGNIAAAASGNNTDIYSLAGPSLGAATAATAPPGTNTAQVANTAFVTNALGGYVAKAGDTMSGQLNITYTAPAIQWIYPGNFNWFLQMKSDARMHFLRGSDSASMLSIGANGDVQTGQLGDLKTYIDGKAPLASPALTGTPTVPTATVGTSTTQAASTAYVMAATNAFSVAPAGATDFTANGSYYTIATVDFTATGTKADVWGSVAFNHQSTAGVVLKAYVDLFDKTASTVAATGPETQTYANSSYCPVTSLSPRLSTAALTAGKTYTLRLWIFRSAANGPTGINAPAAGGVTL